MCWFEEYTVRDRFVCVKGKPIELRANSLKKPEKKYMVLDSPRIFKIQEKKHILDTIIYQKNDKYFPIHLIYESIL